MQRSSHAKGHHIGHQQTHTLPQSLSRSHTVTLSLSHSLTLSLSHTLTLSLSHTHSLTLSSASHHAVHSTRRDTRVTTNARAQACSNFLLWCATRSVSLRPLGSATPVAPVTCAPSLPDAFFFSEGNKVQRQCCSNHRASSTSCESGNRACVETERGGLSCLTTETGTRACCV